MVGEVQLPTIAKGPILRRPKVVAGVERLGLEARAVKRMQKVSEKYGRGPVMLNLPGKRMARVLNPSCRSCRRRRSACSSRWSVTAVS